MVAYGKDHTRIFVMSVPPGLGIPTEVNLEADL